MGAAAKLGAESRVFRSGMTNEDRGTKHAQVFDGLYFRRVIVHAGVGQRGPGKECGQVVANGVQ